MKTFRDAAVCECGDHGFVGLTRGAVTIIDPQDVPLFKGQLWCAKQGYVKRTVYPPEGGKVQETMHRIILRPHEGQQVDHQNNDGFDNRRANLRVCSHGENMQNRGAWGGAAYRGVDFHKKSGLFRARVHSRKKTIHVGFFPTAEDAARAYDAAASLHHGKFARTNEMLGLIGGDQ